MLENCFISTKIF